MGTIEAIYFGLTIVFFCWVLVRKNWFGSELLTGRNAMLLFIIKLCVGLGFTLLYAFYYDDRGNSDAFKFYDDAMVLYGHFQQDGWSWFKLMMGVDMDNPKIISMVDELDHWFKLYKRGIFNDNQTIIRFHAILMPITQGYYFVHLVIINFCSTLGVLAMFRFFEEWGVKNKWFFLICAFVPQVVFWSSGLLKEGILFSVLGWLLLLGNRLSQEIKWTTVLGFVLAVYLSFLVKNYVILCLIPGTLMLLVSRKIPQLSPWIIGLAVLVGSIIFSVGMNEVFDLGIPDRISQKQHDFINEAQLSQAGSYFESFVVERNWVSVLMNAPWAFWNTLTQPFIWGAKNVLMLGAGVENILLFVWILIMLVFPKKEFLNSSQAAFATLFVVLLFILIGLVTPIAGALVRYRIPAIPFFVFLLFQGTNWEKIHQLVFKK